jgi:hypothetical protein
MAQNAVQHLAKIPIYSLPKLVRSRRHTALRTAHWLASNSSKVSSASSPRTHLELSPAVILKGGAL